MKRNKVIKAIGKYIYFGLAYITCDGTIMELQGDTYRRISVRNNFYHWRELLCGSYINISRVRFPESSKCWGYVSHAIVSDSYKDRNIFSVSPLVRTRFVHPKTTLLLEIGDLGLSEEK